MSGTALVPRTGGLNLSWVARALSGQPFSLVNGNVDADLNGQIAEPLAAGSYSGTGTNAFTVKDYTAERNGARGPGFFELDVRIGYAVPIHGRRLELSVDVFNVTDHVNYGVPTGNQASPNFLILNGYSTSYTPRKAQIGVRFEF